MKPPRKILVIRLSSLGDILHTLAAFQSLRESFPRARLGWLVERRASFLLDAVPGIDAVHVIDTGAIRRLPWAPAGWRDLWGALRGIRAESYDLSIDFQGLLKTGVMSLLSGAPRRIGFSAGLVREKPAHWFYNETLRRTGVQGHVVGLNRLLAAMSGAREAPNRTVLAASDSDRCAIEARLAGEKLSRFVVINPGGGWPTKRWPPERYGKLAERIAAELQLRVVVTTGPGEEEMYREIAAQCPTRPPAHFPVPFLQLIPLLQRARLMIGGDTGPFHLACALGTPVVGIFGPTSAERNGPWAPEDEAVSRLLPCSYCYGRACPTENECMDVPVADVFSAVVRRLGRDDESFGFD